MTTNTLDHTSSIGAPSEHSAHGLNGDAQAVWEKDRDHFIHPFTDFSTFHEQGCDIISDSGGIYVSDIEGNRFILTPASPSNSSLPGAVYNFGHAQFIHIVNDCVDVVN